MRHPIKKGMSLEVFDSLFFIFFLNVYASTTIKECAMPKIKWKNTSLKEDGEVKNAFSQKELLKYSHIFQGLTSLTNWIHNKISYKVESISKAFCGLCMYTFTFENFQMKYPVFSLSAKYITITYLLYVICLLLLIDVCQEEPVARFRTVYQ